MNAYNVSSDIVPPVEHSLYRTAQGKHAKKPLGSPALERW